MKKNDTIVLNDIKFSGSTAIASASGVSAMIGDEGMEEFSDAYKKRVEKDTLEYNADSINKSLSKYLSATYLQ